MTTRKKREVGKRYYFSYEDVTFNEEGWADPNWYKPLACDLVQLKVWSPPPIDIVAEYRGWWNGKYWEGARMKTCDSVLAWKLCADSEIGVDERGRPITTRGKRILKNLPKTQVKYDD